MTPIDWLHFPSLSALRAFEATARLGGFSAAARALNVTHAAVAQQVRGLEDILGFPLIVREGRTMAMTAEGRRLAQAANAGFRSIQDALAELNLARNVRALSVTVTPIFAEKWLVPRLKGFWAKHPDISLTLRPEHRVIDLRRESIDLGVRFGQGHWPGVDASFLTSARFVVVGAPKVLGGKSVLSTAEMAAMPWIIEESWAEPISWLLSHGINTEKTQKTELPTVELALSAARAGYGLFATNSALIEQDLKEDLLRIVFDPQDDNPGYYVVSAKGPQKLAAQEFIKWLKSTV